MANALDMLVRAKFQINAVGITNQLGCRIPADEVRQIAAHIRRKRKLSIAERARARKSGGNMAGRAFYTLAGLGLGAAAALHRRAFFQQHNFFLCFPAHHLERGKNTSGACPNNDNICLHLILPPYELKNLTIGVLFRKKAANRKSVQRSLLESAIAS